MQEAKQYAIRVSGLNIIDIPIGSIEVGERFRKEMGDIAALAQNITKEGLIQPIAVEANDGDSELPYKLVAGGRRFAALWLIAEKTGKGVELPVSARIYKDLSEHDLRVLEYSENMYRKDLTWHEKIKLERRIHELQVSLYGKKHSTAPDAPGWSQNDTAELMGKSVGKISDDLRFAKMMEEFAEVDWGGFKTKADADKAIKYAKKAATQTVEARKAERILKTGDERKRILIDAYKVGDFFEGVKKIGDATMDFVEIDPPYAIGLEGVKKGYVSSGYSGYNEIDPKDYPDFMKRTFAEAYRTLKKDAWMICWFGPEPWFERIYEWITGAGFRTLRMCGIWVKGIDEGDGFVSQTQGQTMNPEYTLANCYEMFFWAKKGTPILNNPGRGNVFGFRPVPSALKYHPTERPKELMTNILRTFCAPNSNVLVPFAGSGRTLIEAAKLSMIPYGWDLTKDYRDGYIIRINQEI